MSAKTWLILLSALTLLFAAAPAPAYSQGTPPPVTQSIPGGEVSAPAGAPAPGGPGYLMLHATAFHPGTSNALYMNHLLLQTLAGSPSGTWYYEAPVTLPQGATVTRLTLYYRDNDPVNNISLTLWRSAEPGAGASGMATLSTPISPASAIDTYIQTTTIFSPVIDNAANAYYLEVIIPPSATLNTLCISAVRIDYQYSLALPDIKK